MVGSDLLLTRSPFDLHVLVPIASIIPAPISNAIFHGLVSSCHPGSFFSLLLVFFPLFFVLLLFPLPPLPPSFLSSYLSASLVFFWLRLDSGSVWILARFGVFLASFLLLSCFVVVPLSFLLLWCFLWWCPLFLSASLVFFWFRLVFFWFRLVFFWLGCLFCSVLPPPPPSFLSSYLSALVFFWFRLVFKRFRRLFSLDWN
jgi:hypothetical protein